MLDVVAFDEVVAGVNSLCLEKKVCFQKDFFDDVRREDVLVEGCCVEYVAKCMLLQGSCVVVA